MPNVNDLLSKAINETARLNKGETFIVRDLFKFHVAIDYCLGRFF